MDGWTLDWPSVAATPPNFERPPVAGERGTLGDRAAGEDWRADATKHKIPDFRIVLPTARLRIYGGMTATMWFVILAAFLRCLLLVCPESILHIFNLSTTLNDQFFCMCRFLREDILDPLGIGKNKIDLNRSSICHRRFPDSDFIFFQGSLRLSGFDLFKVFLGNLGNTEQHFIQMIISKTKCFRAQYINDLILGIHWFQLFLSGTEG